MYDILESLKAVSAREFVVEVTELLETMRERLGPTPFHLVEREPPVWSVRLSSTANANEASESGKRIIRSVNARVCFHGQESEKYVSDPRGAVAVTVTPSEEKKTDHQCLTRPEVKESPSRVILVGGKLPIIPCKMLGDL